MFKRVCREETCRLILSGGRKDCIGMYNVNTDHISLLYESFPVHEAFRIAQKREMHYTPKHGSWMNIAECELSVLGL